MNKITVFCSIALHLYANTYVFLQCAYISVLISKIIEWLNHFSSVAIDPSPKKYIRYL